MGHSTHVAIIDIDQARTADEAIQVAVSQWRDEEHGDAREGQSKTYPLMTEMAAQYPAGGRGFEVYDGVSVAIPICGADDVVDTTVKKTIEISSHLLMRVRKFGPGEFWETVRELGGVNVTRIMPGPLPKPQKPVAAATAGKAATKYFLAESDGRRLGDYFDSQSAARAAGIALMNEHPNVASLEVRASIIRGDNDRALVSIKRMQPELVKMTIDITTSVPKPGAKQTGWHVSFDYHH